MTKKLFRSTVLILLTLAVLASAGCAGAEKNIVLTFTGDCTIGCTERTRVNPDSFASVAEAKGYDYFFKNYREMFEQDDLTVINFEGVLTDKKAQESQSKVYRFRGPTDYVKILTGSSIEACSLDNNHTGDFGPQGEESTKATLEANGIKWFQKFKPYIFEKDGIKIAFVSFWQIWKEAEFGKAKELMRMLKEEEKVNSIIVCWHAGLEYRGIHESNIERTSKTFVKLGADLIILNHPHVLQGMNIFDNRCIFYSMGNFVFGGNARIKTEKLGMNDTVSSLYSIVVQARLTFSDEGKYLGQQVVIYPTVNSSGGFDNHGVQINNFQPYRANAEEAEIIRGAIQRDTAFTLPEVSIGADGLSRIDLGYLAAFDGVEIPEGGTEGPQGVPEASNPTPTRNDKAK